MSRWLPLLVSCCFSVASAQAAVPVLVIHGGAGVIKSDLTPEREKLVRADLEAALAAGNAVLKSGGSSMDAVTKAILILEDSPRFNAGKGAVFTHDGRNELDAAIMDGATLRAGAIAGERDRSTLTALLSQPISVAELVIGKYAGLTVAVWMAIALSRNSAARSWSDVVRRSHHK